jgi:hypothetical protein
MRDAARGIGVIDQDAEGGMEESRPEPRMSPSEARRSIAHVLCRERIFRALVLALGAYLVVGWIRPQTISGMSPSAQSAAKASWSRCSELVLGGDSRTHAAVSPAVLQETLPYPRILNFGFNNAGFSKEYLAALERILDTNSSPTAIVLGVTPHSLTQETVGRFASRSSRDRSRPGIFRRAPLLKSAWFANLTQSIPMNYAFLFFLAPARMPHYEGIYHPDGWVASRIRPPQPQKGFTVAERWARTTRIDSTLVAGLLTQVQDWSSRGIRVYAFRPPTTERMVRFEDERSGFDEADFVARFEGAGGRWLRMDQAAYTTDDSSHLDRDAAVVFSRDLARAIRAREDP